MVHCLDTPKSWRKNQKAATIMREVTRWHVEERRWAGVAYAALCTYSGDEAKGRDLNNDGDVWAETGAGAKGHNRDTIHLALQGGKGGAADDAFSDHYTPAQDKWLRDTIAKIQKAAGRKLQVMGHNEVSAKACPCFNVGEWLENSTSSVPKVTRLNHKKPTTSEHWFATLLKSLFGVTK